MCSISRTLLGIMLISCSTFCTFLPYVHVSSKVMNTVRHSVIVVTENICDHVSNVCLLIVIIRMQRLLFASLLLFSRGKNL